MNSRERTVVARLASGLVIRGTVLDFTPERAAFRVTPEGGGRGVEVKLRDLKALFFTKIPGERPPGLHHGYYPTVDPVTGGKRLSVRFRDGEIMTGYALSYRPDKPGFFLFPDDPDSQHEKIFVLASQVEQVHLIGPEVSPAVRAKSRDRSRDGEKAA